MLGLNQHGRAASGAQVLLQLRDADVTNPDPVKNLVGCYKRGDILQVLPPTAHDGDLAANPIAAPWWFLRVVGIPRAVALKYQGSEVGGSNRRRLYRVVFEDLPAAVRAALTAQRYAVVQWGALRSAVRNKATNQTEP